MLCLVVLSLASCRPLPDSEIPLPRRSVTPAPDGASQVTRAWHAAIESESPAVITHTENELTALAAANLHGAPLDDVRLWIEPDEVLVTARCTSRACRHLRARVAISADSGRVRLDTLAATVDGRAVPRFVLASLRTALNDALVDTHLPVRIDQVTLRTGAVDIHVSPADG